MNTMLWLVLLLSAVLQAPIAPRTAPPSAVAQEKFWCPMHPHVRSATEGTCPVCRMTLVPIPAAVVGEFRMEVTQIPAARGQGLDGLRPAIRDPRSVGTPSFVTVHDKPMHLFIVGQALDYFAHVHPDHGGDGGFNLRHAIPPGEYMVIADFLPVGGVPQTVQRAIVTPGFDIARRRPATVLRPTGNGEPVVGPDVKVTMEARDVVAGKFSLLRFTLADSRTGAPVTDLEPYLAAPAHLLVASADLTHVVHGHPDDEGTRGPTVSFDLLMPMPGFYKIWLQVQRMGRVQTLPFVVQVK